MRYFNITLKQSKILIQIYFMTIKLIIGYINLLILLKNSSFKIMGLKCHNNLHQIFH